MASRETSLYMNREPAFLLHTNPPSSTPSHYALNEILHTTTTTQAQEKAFLVFFCIMRGMKNARGKLLLLLLLLLDDNHRRVNCQRPFERVVQSHIYHEAYR